MKASNQKTQRKLKDVMRNISVASIIRRISTTRIREVDAPELEKVDIELTALLKAVKEKLPVELWDNVTAKLWFSFEAEIRNNPDIYPLHRELFARAEIKAHLRKVDREGRCIVELNDEEVYA